MNEWMNELLLRYLIRSISLLRCFMGIKLPWKNFCKNSPLENNNVQKNTAAIAAICERYFVLLINFRWEWELCCFIAFILMMMIMLLLLLLWWYFTFTKDEHEFYRINCCWLNKIKKGIIIVECETEIYSSCISYH